MNISKNRITKAKVEEAILGSYGIMTTIAKRVGCSRRGLYYFLEKPENNDLIKLIEDEEETLLDLAEHNVIKALKSKDKNERKWSSMFILNTRGAIRGYGSKNENTNKNIDVQKIMKELEDDMPNSIPYIERIARGEDFTKVYSEFKQFNNSINVNTNSFSKN